MKTRSWLFVSGLVTLTMGLANVSFSQTGGTINLANSGDCLVTIGPTSNLVTSAQGIKSALYWAPTIPGSFTPLGASVTVGHPVAGIFASGTRYTPTSGGSVGFFQVRAWGGGSATYEQALTVPGAFVGTSVVVQVVTGNPLGAPPTPPASLVAAGLQSFALSNGHDVPLAILCATDKLVECGTTWDFDPPTTTNGCGGVTITELSTEKNGDCPQTLTRTWQATDVCGAIRTCSQTVMVLCPDCPALRVTKTCPPYPVPPGGMLAWTGSITNAGSLALSNVIVLNSQPVANTLVFGPATLAPGAGAFFNGNYAVPACSCGPHLDTLTASGLAANGILFSNVVTTACAGTNAIVPGDTNGDGIVDQAELNVVLANYWAHSPWVCMTNAALLGEGKFQFELTNATAWNFSVLVTTNLVDWTNLPGPAFPVYQFLDSEGTNARQRFYRLRWP